MQNLVCPCGYVHNLTRIPDDGYTVVRDRDLEAFAEVVIRLWDLRRSAPGSPAWVGALREYNRLRGLLYECPHCGRLLWRRTDGDGFQVFDPARGGGIEGELPQRAEG